MRIGALEAMTWYQILCLVGVPTLSGTVVGALIAALIAKKKENTALKSGVQALLRDRLLEKYKEAKSEGSVGYDDRANFENLYNHYHNMGKNGVMDKIRDEYLGIPMK